MGQRLSFFAQRFSHKVILRQGVLESGMQRRRLRLGVRFDFS